MYQILHTTALQLISLQILYQTTVQIVLTVFHELH